MADKTLERMKARETPALLATVREALTYDSETGILHWRIRPSQRVQAGTVAGYAGPNGYWAVGLKRQEVLAHRAAWAIYCGSWPVTYLDHVNGDKTDNRIANLRPATRSQNCVNRRSWGPHRGVVRRVSRRTGLVSWQAHIQVDGKDKTIGTFSTLAAARDAYEREAAVLHGDFVNQARDEAMRVRR